MELGVEEAQICRLCGQYESIYIDVFGEEGTKRFLGLKIHKKINILVSTMLRGSPRGPGPNCIINGGGQKNGRKGEAHDKKKKYIYSPFFVNVSPFVERPRITISTPMFETFSLYVFIYNNFNERDCSFRILKRFMYFAETYMYFLHLMLIIFYITNRESK